ncbi:hypothetical protein [Nocardia sp. NPDC005998]|uniref:hypothetical protein n=1 Tax=Nocardia sp. NPDC005998 TaxID=3156894 RepID=UPI0033A6CAFE
MAFYNFGLRFLRFTVDNRYFVWRSGVDITADGNIVYAMGPALSVRTRAELLHRAGAVRAMEFDINTEWVSFMTCDSIRDPINPPAIKLLPEFRRNGDATSTPANATSPPSTVVSLARIRRCRTAGRHPSFVC